MMRDRDLISQAEQARATARGYQSAGGALIAQLIISWLLNLVVLGVALCIALLSLNLGLSFGAGAAIAASPLSLYGVAILVGLLQAPSPKPAPHPKAQLTLELEQHPKLLAMLERLCAQQQVAMPRQVRLNPEVNAAVMVDHRQRGYVLILGLGMLNALDVEALAAVLAHELAHAGQRAMTLGLLVELTHRARTHLMMHPEHQPLSARASRPWRMLLLWDAQRLARRYKALIYHMELDADAKATAHTSADALVRAIERLDHADVAMQHTLEELDLASRERQYTDDIFVHHRAWLARTPYALSERSSYGAHPSDAQRAERALAHQRADAPGDASQAAPLEAWMLFEQPHTLSQRISAMMYSQRLEISAATLPLQPAQKLERFLAKERALLRSPSSYAGLYDPYGPVALSAPSQLREDLEARDIKQLWDSFEALALQRGELEQDAQTLNTLSLDPAADLIWRGQRHEAHDLEQLAAQLFDERHQWERRRLKAHEALWALAYACERERAAKLDPSLEQRADAQRILRWALEQHQLLHDELTLVKQALDQPQPRTTQQEEQAHKTLTLSFEIIEALLKALDGFPITWTQTPQQAHQTQTLDALLSPSPLIQPAAKPGDAARDLLMYDQFEEIFNRCWRVARKDEVNLLVTIKTLLETWQASKNPE